MPRYYERESLIDFVKQNTPHINGETTMECVERAIQKAPTADVVPKSEVEEIFAEIENTLNQWIKLYYTITVSTFDSIEQAKAMASESALRAFRDYVAELKKKYTGVENDRD